MVPNRPAFDDYLHELLFGKDIGLVKIEDFRATLFDHFRETPVNWKRLHFYNLQDRRAALTIIRGAEERTANDDQTNYYRQAAQVLGLPLTQWGTLSNYVQGEKALDSFRFSALSDHVVEYTRHIQAPSESGPAARRPCCVFQDFEFQNWVLDSTVMRGVRNVFFSSAWFALSQ
jgi:hypothetical protein